MIPHRYHARTPVADRKQAHAADPHKYRDWTPKIMTWEVRYHRHLVVPVSLARIEFVRTKP